MEPTSEPRWHHQRPMSIRVHCEPHAMPQDPTDGRPPWAPTEAPLSLTLGSPSGSPGLARGPLGRLREVSQGRREAREGPRTEACGRVHWRRTRVNAWAKDGLYRGANGLPISSGDARTMSPRAALEGDSEGVNARSLASAPDDAAGRDCGVSAVVSMVVDSEGAAASEDWQSSFSGTPATL